MKILWLVPFIFAANSWASGGACPSGANYLNSSNPTGSLVTLSSLGVTSCYYVSAGGSDTNSGTSESSPWAHAPFMPAATGNPAALATSLSGTAAAGLGFIFKGGDSWHFGNSGASPYTGGTWQFNTGTLWSGTSSNPIYFGVDPAWYSGSSWSRPILTADNPVCNGSTLGGNCVAYTANYWQQYYVNSCAYQIAGGSNMIDASWISYYVFDNFEMTGICLNTPGQPYSSDSYVVYNNPHGEHVFENLYIHGWTHTSFAGPNGSSACNSGTVCMDTLAFIGTPNTGIPSEKILFDVVDGSDSDPTAGGFAYAPLYDVEYSAIRYTSQGIGRQMHTFHDNLYEYFFEDGHSNMLEDADEWSGTNVVYNNVLRNLETVGGTNGVGIWLNPSVGNTDYFFNNLIYNEGQMELFNVGNTITPSTNTGSYVLLNNTIDLTAGSGISVPCNRYATSSFSIVNTHFITETTPYTTGCAGSMGPFTTNLTMNHAAATAAGYTTTQTYVDSPASSSGATVGKGTNQQSICSGISGDSSLSAAAASCSRDTTYAVVYNASTHTVSAPGRTTNARPGSSPWDIGAYGYSNSPSPAPPASAKATAVPRS